MSGTDRMRYGTFGTAGPRESRVTAQTLNRSKTNNFVKNLKRNIQVEKNNYICKSNELKFLKTKFYQINKVRNKMCYRTCSIEGFCGPKFFTDFFIKEDGKLLNCEGRSFYRGDALWYINSDKTLHLYEFHAIEIVILNYLSSTELTESKDIKNNVKINLNNSLIDSKIIESRLKALHRDELIEYNSNSYKLTDLGMKEIGPRNQLLILGQNKFYDSLTHLENKNNLTSNTIQIDKAYKVLKNEMIDKFDALYFGALSDATNKNISEMARRSGMERAHVRSHLSKIKSSQPNSLKECNLNKKNILSDDVILQKSCLDF